jgi:hypothetical protein
LPPSTLFARKKAHGDFFERARGKQKETRRPYVHKTSIFPGYNKNNPITPGKGRGAEGLKNIERGEDFMADRIVLNTVSYHGKGAIENIVPELTARGFKKAFVCSDPDLIKFNVTKKVTDLLDAASFAYEIYSEIKPNPTIENVQTGVAAFQKSSADCIVAIGGGSSMDTAKAVIVENPEFADVRSLEGVAATKKHAVFTIAVPTTAGTAAEVTINYVITDVEKKRKFVCVDTHDIPEVAVIDPDMMASMPKGLTAATGMDARHRGLHHQGCVGNDGYVPSEGHRADREASARRGGEHRRGPRGHGAGAVYRRNGLFQCRPWHRPQHGARPRRAV